MRVPEVDVKIQCVSLGFEMGQICYSPSGALAHSVSISRCPDSPGTWGVGTCNFHLALSDTRIICKVAPEKYLPGFPGSDPKSLVVLTRWSRRTL